MSEKRATTRRLDVRRFTGYVCNPNDAMPASIGGKLCWKPSLHSLS